MQIDIINLFNNVSNPSIIPLPRVSVFTSGSGNYSSLPGAKYLQVEGIGGGGGGGAGGYSGNNQIGSNGSNGGNTTFDILTAYGGNGGEGGNYGGSGKPGQNGTGGGASNGQLNVPGSNAMAQNLVGQSVYAALGTGGQGGAQVQAGGGGGGSGYFKHFSYPPGNYSWSVGSGGPGGSGGTSYTPGLSGQNGILIIVEYYA